MSNDKNIILEDNLSTIFGEKNVCTSVQCVQSAAEILNSIDKKIDPCEDFYGFACNGWIKNNPIPKVELVSKALERDPKKDQVFAVQSKRRRHY